MREGTWWRGMPAGAEDLIGQGELSTMLHLVAPSQDSAAVPQKLGAMYSTLAQHGLPDSAIRNYLAQQLLIRQHLERIHQLAQHEIEMEQTKAKFEEERKKAREASQYSTVSGPPVSSPTQQPVDSEDADAPVGKPATDDQTGTWDTVAETTSTDPAPAPAPDAVEQDPVVKEAEPTGEVGMGDSLWKIGCGVLPDGMPCEGEWLDGTMYDTWLDDDAKSSVDRSSMVSVHQLDTSQISASQVEPAQQVDDCTPGSEVGDAPTSPNLDAFAPRTLGCHSAEQPEPKRQKMSAHDAGSRRLPTSATTVGLADSNLLQPRTVIPPTMGPVQFCNQRDAAKFSCTSSMGRWRSKDSQNILSAVEVAGTPPDALRSSLRVSSAAAAAASPLSDVRAIVQAATFRMLSWQEAAVVLKHCIRLHKAGIGDTVGVDKLLLGPRPDVVISQNPSEQPGALYIEMPKVPRKLIRLKYQQAARRAGRGAEGQTVVPDRWRNSGGGKGSSDLPKGSPKPTVRRRYGAVVPAAPTAAIGSNQRKLKKENSLRYYEYTLLEHKANGELGEHECYLFHVIRPGVPRAANS